MASRCCLALTTCHLCQVFSRHFIPSKLLSKVWVVGASSMSSIPTRERCYPDFMDFLPWTHLHGNSAAPGRTIIPGREIL
ncbi:uncharacterized protein K444DRAFT_79023 [Hyaloscypha bicolor E]|uniref:Uncharacterized protein n=1 Tax=Hyaloscypha bicolor E TaxID=1095630 RepID=A0A2J6SYC4_9HELO|nr:uncharacterized protein K444DRAFT_79023 [Hyaloscypha bicolor E]PMD55767.1 hypothetical protein K444DRAFT_79023 [Hyaloscypha bicolor E]